MSTEIGKNLPSPEEGNPKNTTSSYAIPPEMSAALQKLIADRLMKVTREAQRLGADTGEEVGVDVGWERMPGAAKEFHARSAHSATDQEDAKDRDAVVSDD